MKAPSWLIGKNVLFDAPDTPAAEQARLRARIDVVRRSFRRRLTDRIADLYDEACLAGDLDTAAVLLDAYETSAGRTRAGQGRDRREADGGLSRLRDDLLRRRREVVPA